MNNISSKYYFALFALLSIGVCGYSQSLDNQQIRKMVETYKTEIRGPYKDIRWYCSDGSVVAPKDTCRVKKGNVQRARYKDEVVSLQKSNHVFIGQILSTTPIEDFRDEGNNNSRLKQYQLDQYLRLTDDGWVLRKAQFYRGAIQIEDEEEWGIQFFHQILKDDEIIKRKYFLLRQAAKDIPHKGDDSKTQSVRGLSKFISDTYLPFMDLRVKIHNQPDVRDIQSVKNFVKKHESKLKPELLSKFNQLIADMEDLYEPVELRSLNKFLQPLSPNAPIRQSIESFIRLYDKIEPGQGMLSAIAELLLEIRENMLSEKSVKARLTLLDISIVLEEILFKENENWKVTTLDQLLNKICHLGIAATGTGFIERWEWQAASSILSPRTGDEIKLWELISAMERARAMVEWGSGMIRAVYGDVVNLYSGFEPLAYGFLDDRIRSSVLMPLGACVGQLGDFIAVEASLSNKVFSIPNQSHIRGLNPGYAKGELVVVTESPDEVRVSSTKIYIFERPPADLKPVAGILTVTEGNLVSHVQLLARNLGIPNAVISFNNFQELKKYSGQEIFLAVSNKGTVIVKTLSEMTAEERALFEEKKRKEERVMVPVDKIDLSRVELINLNQLDATSSGKICGPKAANLGQLKQMFPKNVVEGMVIPFGIFRKHMDQKMSGKNISYWEFLNEVFSKAAAMSQAGTSDSEVDKFQLSELEILRNAIKQIDLQPAFLADLEKAFMEILGDRMGKVPVFLRSDTNMEDLKDFTGAGLNLTLFNVVEKEKIIQGIKDVWASPYTERSFKWRQKFLLNPENVFPSILIIPSVDVDHSGVLITKGLQTNNDNDLTIAFSRGAGGAVDGQAAESYALYAFGGVRILSPAREPVFSRLPTSGGTKKVFATFESRIVTNDNFTILREISEEIKRKLPTVKGVETAGPFDVELGFKDGELWLFQVRPYVENKKAMSSSYLQSITPAIPHEKKIKMNSLLNRAS